MNARARLLLAAAGLLPPAVLGAQTLPVPELPAETAPETAPPASPGPPGDTRRADVEAIASSAPPRPAAWELEVGAGLGWDSNIDFQPASGPSDAIVVPRVAAARVVRSRHAELRATASGSWSGYRDHDELRRIHADFGLDGSVDSSPRTRWHGGARYGIGDTASASILREQGVALPRVRTRTLAAGADVTRLVGRRATLRVEGRFHGADFDSPELIDGGSARASVGMERPIGRRDAAGIDYALEHVLSDRPRGSYLTHFASLRWTRLVSRRAAVLVQGGASSTPEAAAAGLAHDLSFFGGASLAGTAGRSSYTVFLRREVAPAFGTGQSRLDLRAGIRATIALGRDWAIDLETSHVRPDRAPTGTETGASHDGFASVGRRFGGGFEIAGETRYRRLDAGGGRPPIRELEAGLFLTLRVAARRERVVPLR
jgi:hypothetical protein